MHKYGIDWHDRTELEIELYCIARGGGFGVDLFDHYMVARKLAWPDRYQHEWTELMYREFIKNDITILVGCASSQKTSHASEFILLNYWARPHNTLCIVSTLKANKLELGVFGEIKKLFNKARDIHPDLAGNLIDHKHCIATDNLKEDGKRDLRKGIIGRACFPSGTRVDTPTGTVAIETIVAGDSVVNACGCGIVKETMNKIAGSLVRVWISDGTSFDCTPDHSIFTGRGWISAIDLKTCDLVLSGDETLQILRNGYRSRLSEPIVLQRGMPQQKGNEDLRTMQQSISEMGQMDGKILHDHMCWEVGISAHQARSRFQLSSLRKTDVFSSQPHVLFSKMQAASQANALQEMREYVHFNPRQPEEETLNFLQSALLLELEGKADFEEQQLSNTDRTCSLESVSQSNSVELSNPYRNQAEERFQALGQGGCGIPGHKTGCGNRWRGSSDTCGHGERQEKRRKTAGNWVVGVEILDQRSDKRFSESEGGYRVYNLEVEGHPSYSVNGVIVHNCKEGNRWVGLGDLAGTKQDYVFYLADELQYMEPAFIGAWPNLFSNNTPAGGRVKIIGSGNPNHDPDDQLGIAAEPKCGWQSMGEPKETTTWPTRFMGGVTVNLVGTDSPNFRAVAKGLPEPYHGLIGPQFAARLAHDWGGEGSPQYYSQVKGVMRLDMANDRVITRQICREHKAFDKVTWQGGNITSIYFLDPSYGGKDACIGGILKFGAAIDGTIIVQIAMVKQLTIDLRIVDKMSVEDQIANQVADDLERHNIPVENCFYDPYGKGTIGFAFARRFGHTCPIPVDSGGKPTERPVRDDLYMYDKGKRRLKKCSEHYCKFVSEAWFSVRYTIEAGQLRELPDDVMLEGCARTYQMVGGNKIEIEPKDDYKERTGKSPNKFDGLAIGIEGCRQRGFRIGKLGEVEGDGEGLNWLAERSQNNRKLFSSKQLVHR